MQSRPNGTFGDVRGREEMKALTASAVGALEQADLIDEMSLLRDRVFSLRPELLVDTTWNGEQWQWSFKPMVELLLHYVRDVASAARPIDERRREILWVIEAAGF